MLRLLLPVILLLVGVGSGIGAGIFLAPAEPDTAEAMADKDGAINDPEKPSEAKAKPKEADEERAFVKLNNQFVVPVLDKGAVTSLVVMSLSLEVNAAASEDVYGMEPKIRDRLLQVLFDHANAGGFDGAFTNSTKLLSLRKALREAAQKTLGQDVSDVLIVDILRQAT